TDDIHVPEMITGIKPRESYQKSRSYPYPVEKDGKMYPLRLLAQATGVNNSFESSYGEIKPIGISTNDHMAVISMGGLDLGSNIMRILLGMEYFINSTLNDKFKADYEKVIVSAQKSCKKIVIIS